MLMSYIKSVLGEVTSENSPYHAIKSNLEDSNNIREKNSPFYILGYFCFNPLQ